MKVYTAHTKPHAAPVLVREGFSRSALVFGPFWLLANGAWIAGIIALCADVASFALLPATAARVLAFGVAWLIGLFGEDIRRWSLERRGFMEVHVVAADDEDAAMSRLLHRRPDLIADAVL